MNMKMHYLHMGMQLVLQTTRFIRFQPIEYRVRESLGSISLKCKKTGLDTFFHKLQAKLLEIEGERPRNDSESKILFLFYRNNKKLTFLRLQDRLRLGRKRKSFNLIGRQRI